MKRFKPWAASLVLLSFQSLLATLHAQVSEPYGSRNTFGITAVYSNDSSHILLGRADNVKLGAVGFECQRRLIANWHLVGAYLRCPVSVVNTRLLALYGSQG